MRPASSGDGRRGFATPVSNPDSAPWVGITGTLVKLAASQELHAYWNLLRGARSAPERSQIDPGAIRGVLADTFILEVDARRRYPLRIAGARTNALFLRELRGAAFLDLWQEPDQREIAAVLSVVAGEAVAVVAGVSAAPEGMRALELELLLLPLRHHGDTHARVLGACSPAFLPSWIGLVAAAPMRLFTLRVLERSESAGGERSAPPGERVNAGGFSRAREVDRRGHLFIVNSAPR
jgi:hypothetical protein